MGHTTSEALQSVLHIASAHAKENYNDAIYPAHLLKALLHKDSGLIDFIESDLNKDYFYIMEWADARIGLSPKATRIIDDPDLSADAQAALDEAEQYSEKLDSDIIEPVHLLASLLTAGVAFSFEQLKTMPVTVDEVLSKQSTPASGSKKNHSQSTTTYSTTSGKNLAKFTINKNNELQTEERPLIIGFERELQTLFEALGRKNKSNILVVGESGIGKTALIEAFIQRIIKGEIPDFLKDATVLELDLPSVSSEANYKGEVEDRMKKVFAELSTLDNAILVIEGIDRIFDKQSILYGITTLLKKELNRNSIRLIATSSIEGFTKNIETDKEFVSKVEKLYMEEPSVEMAVRIIKGIKKNYENHHQLLIDDQIVVEAIQLAKRFMAERSLPDSALDLIDRTLSHIHTMNNTSGKELELLSKKLETIKAEAKEKKSDDIQFDLQWLYHEVFHRLSALLTSQLDESINFIELENNESKIQHLTTTIEQLQKLTEKKRKKIELPDLSLIVAQQTGIPIGKVQTKERDKLINAEAILKERVVGQDHAIQTVLEAIYESRSGLNKKGQPIASVFFLGPTGTGKTELTKALAEFLFQDESAIIRFDMSEFMESHSVATMTGAPAGYVGYEEGGLLVNKIRQKPYSIVLFDEIEKAHPDVFNIFLQIMDEGRIHDKLNRTGDFSNALIVYTSNVGSDYVFNSFGKGIIPSSNELKQLMMERKFKPEFLGRLTEIIPFSPITKEIVLMIFDIHLKNLHKTLKEMNIKLHIPDETKEQLALSEFSPELGARPILGIIRNQIRRPLSKLIISGKVKNGSVVELQYKDGEYNWIY
jgi:ATP-dependent Clp protease ATP-binding subunit ClpA